MLPSSISDTRYLLFQPFQCPCASLFNIPVLGAKASAKIQPFSIPPKFFFVFFRRISSNGWTTGRYGRKKIYSEGPRSRTQAAKTAPQGTKNPKNRQKTGKNTKNAFFPLFHNRLSPFQTPKTANLSTSQHQQHIPTATPRPHRQAAPGRKPPKTAHAIP